MSRERLYLFDTTLRDGAQTPGIDFSLEDKIRVAKTLDRLGVDYIEGGYPGANPTDTEFFASPPELCTARLIAFGMTKRPGRSISNDSGVAGLLAADASGICYVAKSWDFHVTTVLGCSLDENLESIDSSISAAIAVGREAMVDCEHFFDGYKHNRDYAMKCARCAYAAGARWVILCDTNGGTLPHEIKEIVSDIAREIPGTHLGIHTHNDTDNAVANSLAAIRAGVRHVQGTLNGLGERCGNANLISLIPTLMLKSDFAETYEIGVTPESLGELTHASRLLDEILNRSHFSQAPYVGESAFATKAGIHASAIIKDPKTYEHVPPEKVGNQRRLLVSNQGGKSNVLAVLERLGVEVETDDPRIVRLLEDVKAREFLGYAYESAEASFEILARRALGTVPEYFKVESFRIMVERRHNALGEQVTISEATVKINVGGEVMMSVGEGNGPVNALDEALRKDLGIYNSIIADLELVDYKVRILTGGTAAVTRVLIESSDASGDRWFTVGVSPNIVDASFQALTDSITYKLLKTGAQSIGVQP
jgi:2-isopropylmalate synthase